MYIKSLYLETHSVYTYLSLYTNLFYFILNNICNVIYNLRDEKPQRSVKNVNFKTS